MQRDSVATAMPPSRVWPTRSSTCGEELSVREEWRSGEDRVPVKVFGMRRAGTSWPFGRFAHGKPSVLLDAHWAAAGPQFLKVAEQLDPLPGVQSDLPDATALSGCCSGRDGIESRWPSSTVPSFERIGGIIHPHTSVCAAHRCRKPQHRASECERLSPDADPIELYSVILDVDDEFRRHPAPTEPPKPSCTILACRSRAGRTDLLPIGSPGIPEPAIGRQKWSASGRWRRQRV